MDFRAIGLMSGTSLDGLDICLVNFSRKNFEILYAETIAYPEIWEEKLHHAINLPSEDLLALHSEYGFYLGEQVRDFIQKNKIENIDVIASHGHTIFHNPARKFTLQIGDGRAIKIINQIPVVYDFRSQDVLLGGNGAPLVPIGDELLFSDYDACLNLGGFSNISLKRNGKRIAFDISPVNIVLNHFAKKLNQKFDENGDIAKSGKIDEAILHQLNSLSFYEQSHPKSLGIEWVQQTVFPLLKNTNASTAIATFTEHAATQIAKILNEFQVKNVLCTGGGSYNAFLIEKIEEKTNTEIILPSNQLIEYKEALIFSLMGMLRIQNKNNVLCSATGSLHDHSSGIIA